MAKADVANPRRRAIETPPTTLPGRPNPFPSSTVAARSDMLSAQAPAPWSDKSSNPRAQQSSAHLPILRKSSKRVRVANGDVSTATNVTKLPFERLSAAAAEAHEFPDFPDSLMSVGKTNDDGNVSIFTKDGVTVHREEDVLITLRGEPILIGVRDGNGRYRIPLHQSRDSWTPRVPSEAKAAELRQANSVYDLPSMEQGIRWMHAVCGYPVKSTWLKAVKAGNFHGWPLLSPSAIKKYYPETAETPKGHMAQSRKNVRSTKSKPLEIGNPDPLKGIKKRDVAIHVYDARETVFSDQTGKFPVRSQAGHCYVMVLVDIDSSAILVEPLKSRKDAEMIRAYRAIMARLHAANIYPKKHVLDNEISAVMKQLITSEYKMEYELVPPGCHRRNAAEVAIRNFKAHFLSIMAGVADDFPWSQWDKLLPQAEITLNLLRQSNATPAISAYAHINGPFDYNKMPLAPMGCKVQIHEKADQRASWAFHSVDGWYLSTSPEHYRTHLCHVKSTRRNRLADTVQFFHKNITNPTLTHADKIMNAISACAKALKGQPNDISDSQLRDMERMLEAATQRFGRPQQSPAPQPNHANPPTRPQPQAAPRVPTGVPRSSEGAEAPRDDGRRITRSMAAARPLPRVAPNLPNFSPSNSGPGSYSLAYPTGPPPTAPPRKPTTAPPRSPATTPPPPPATPPTTPPAMNTRARSRQAANLQRPPAYNTRSRSKAMPPISLPTQRPAAPPAPKRAGRRSARIAQASGRAMSAQDVKMGRALATIERRLGRAFAVMDKKTGKMLNYRQLLRDPDLRPTWSRSSADEFGRLAQGIGGRIKGSDTIRFIRRSDVPKDRRKDITYGQFVCTFRPEKKDPFRTRFTVGGDRINYPGEVVMPTAEMLVAKILFNSVVSTKNAKFMTMDISNFYLNTPLKRPEFMRLKLSDIPDEVISQYKLNDLAEPDGSVYIKVIRGMYGLPQAGLLANELLEKRLNQAGYHQSKIVPGLWTHDWRPIQFTLVVDDFGVKYVGKEHAQHLKKTLEEHYKITTDWSGERYIGINLMWDYKRRRVHLSMPGYKRWIQQVVGKFLFYGRAVDPTLLCPLSAIAAQSAAPTTETLDRTNQVLDFLATQDDAIITYSASDMVLAAHSDASYLSKPKARSRAGGHFFLSANVDEPPNNGAILNIAHIIKNVMSSATEAELAALYIMAREAVYMRIILEELGHEQPPTPLQTDNSMADGVVNGKITPKRTKAMDMRFHWLRDRECQDQFRIFWRPGKLNYADYWTKHHSAKHHKHMRREFLTPPIVLEMLRLERQQHHAPAAPAA
ncbi:hypothetical protein ACHAXT_001701 [Thalassiosira profunda]